MGDGVLVEVGTPGKLDVFNELGEPDGRLPVLLDEQNHGSARAGDVSQQLDGLGVNTGDQPCAQGTAIVNVIPQRPGQVNRVDVRHADAQLIHQSLHAGGDRSLGKLEFTHVSLSQV